MREVLVDDDPLDEHGVFHLSADLSLDLDQLEVDVLPLDVGYGENGTDGDLRHHAVAFVDDFGT